VALERRFGPAFLASLAAHLAIAALAVFVMRSAAPPSRRASTAAESRHVSLVWLNEPGRGGGGGGGGNRMREPPRRAALPGRDMRTVPATKPPTLNPSAPQTDLDPVQRVIVPAAALAMGTVPLPGAMDAPPAPLATLSQGPGSDGGAGTGRGTGDGPGRGRGFGDGWDRGTGGEIYRPGGDVSMPIEIHKGTPQYTSEAMRARAQGAITVECLVQTTGVCANIRVKRSFNPTFGLDQEAIKAAAQWRFRPGMRRGEAVPVLVTMEIAFVLR
jgi:periplasmic protein TonB